MQTVSIQFIEEPQPRNIIIACEDTDTCPGCGAGYKVWLSACEYCRRPVRLSAENIDKEAIRSRFMRAYSGLGHGIAVLHSGEAVTPRMLDERFRA